MDEAYIHYTQGTTQQLLSTERQSKYIQKKIPPNWVVKKKTPISFFKTLSSIYRVNPKRYYLYNYLFRINIEGKKWCNHYLLWINQNKNDSIKVVNDLPRSYT